MFGFPLVIQLHVYICIQLHAYIIAALTVKCVNVRPCWVLHECVCFISYHGITHVPCCDDTDCENV